MTNIEEVLVNLKNAASNYLYLTTIDKTLFNDYLNHCYYLKGVINFDTKKLHTYSTTYQGVLVLDNSKDVFYYNGGLSADEEGVNVSIGTLTLP